MVLMQKNFQTSTCPNLIASFLGTLSVIQKNSGSTFKHNTKIWQMKGSYFWLRRTPLKPPFELSKPVYGLLIKHFLLQPQTLSNVKHHTLGAK